jgi:hypothetical protein
MPLQAGDRIPDVTLLTLDPRGQPRPISTGEI